MLGLSSGSRISDAIGLYEEGGMTLILPSENFSSENYHIGGYGIFGFEFYFSEHFTYFFEAGGIGINAVANKIENNPIYSNGFIASVGCKAKF